MHLFHNEYYLLLVDDVDTENSTTQYTPTLALNAQLSDDHIEEQIEDCLITALVVIGMYNFNFEGIVYNSKHQGETASVMCSPSYIMQPDERSKVTPALFVKLALKAITN